MTASASEGRVTVDELLLDAGVWIASWSPEERFAAPARELVTRVGRHAAALDLTLYEVANSIAARRGDALGAAILCRSVERRCRYELVRIDDHLIEATAEVAVEYGLSSYDAAYVAVAQRHDWQLVSTDIKDLVSKGLAITPDAAV